MNWWHHEHCTGRCIACLIENLVRDAYGTQGLEYLLRHVSSPTVTATQHTALLYAVERKHPGETRFDTALRYIRETEGGRNDPSAARQAGCVNA